VSVLTELSELVYLDISDDKEESQLYDILTPGSRFKVSALLQRPLSLPKLHSFDISGESPAVNSRIRIQHYFLIADPGPYSDPDPVPDPAF
jgi:hypothetical protein